MMDFEDAIRRATEAAEVAPDDLRQVAFKTVLDRILSAAGSRGAAVDDREESDLVDDASPPGGEGGQVVHDALPDADLVKRKGTRAHHALWAMATLHARGQEVTTDAIRETIRRELGIAPQNTGNTGRTLRAKTPKYVMRREDPGGQGYIYEPTGRLLDAFQDLKG